jgi:glutamate/tyrosine decarboxylase-like PLP-dependent enzyme
MQDYLDILSRAVRQWTTQDRPVSQTPVASELESTLNLALGEEGCSIGELEHVIKDYIAYSPDVSQPGFNKLLYSGVNYPALLGDWITSLANSTMHTYQVGPVATLMELELIHQWNQLIGFNEGEGVMVAGGSQANLIGMMLARHQAYPASKTEGLVGRKLVAYVSDQAHYSNQRAANVLGIGTDNLISVASDAEGQMQPEALEQAIQQTLAAGDLPFFIGLTAGTTVIGAYDCVSEASKIAKKHNIWLHIDGAWGAPVLFSDTYKELINNSHLADSFAWDAHKLMNVPITAAVILVKKPGCLKSCIAGGGGEYLFHQDANASYNLGERSIQCGRRADALKVWLSWKAIGRQGFAKKIDDLQATKEFCVTKVNAEAALEMLAPAVYLNVLFRYVPSSLKEVNPENEAAVGKLNMAITKTMMAEGGAYSDYAHYKGRVGIRLIIANEFMSNEHITSLLAQCVSIGKRLEKDFV